MPYRALHIHPRKLYKSPEGPGGGAPHQPNAPRRNGRPPGMPQLPPPPLPDAPKPERKKLVVVDTRESMDSQARDVADRRMTESEAELKGFKNLPTRFWKHNLFRELYRQKEIAKVKQQMLESGNLFVGEKDRGGKEIEAGNLDPAYSAMESVVNRFASDFQEAVHEGEEKELLEGDEGKKFKVEMQGLMFKLATQSISEEEFYKQGNQMMRNLLMEDEKERAEMLTPHLQFANNLHEFAHAAKQMQGFEKEEKSLKALVDDYDIVIGKAKMGVRTKENLSAVDRISEKIMSSKLGAWVNEATVTTALATAYSIGAFTSKSVAKSRMAAWLSFGGTLAAGAGIAAAREGLKLKRMRTQHERERAKGAIPNAADAQRAQMEQYSYESVSAKDSVQRMREIMGRLTTQDACVELMVQLATVESRIELSDSRGIDMLAYSGFDNLEKERLDLDIARAEAKVALRKAASANVIRFAEGDFNKNLETLTESVRAGLERGENGIEQKDRLFAKMRRNKMMKTAAVAVATGAVMGTVFQEASAFFHHGQLGALEHTVEQGSGPHALDFDHDAGEVPESITVAEKLREHIDGAQAHATHGINAAPASPLHTVTFPGKNIHLKISESMSVLANNTPAGTYSVYDGGKLISTELHFSSDGQPVLDRGLMEALGQHGISVSDTPKYIEHQVEVVETPQDTVDAHKDLFAHRIHRDGWYDNDHEKPSANQLKLNWGGTHGTGIDKNGNYVYSIANMKIGGSTHEGWGSLDVQKAVHDGKIKLLLSLSKDTQFQPVEVPIDAHGNAIIDPKSDIAKMFFKVGHNSDGEPQLEFTGRFAEVAYSTGRASDGAEIFRILANDEGKGMESAVKEIVSVTSVSHSVRFEQADLAGHGSHSTSDTHVGVPSHASVDPMPIIPAPLSGPSLKPVIGYEGGLAPNVPPNTLGASGSGAAAEAGAATSAFVQSENRPVQQAQQQETMEEQRQDKEEKEREAAAFEKTGRPRTLVEWDYCKRYLGVRLVEFTRDKIDIERLKANGAIYRRSVVSKIEAILNDVIDRTELETSSDEKMFLDYIENLGLVCVRDEDGKLKITEPKQAVRLIMRINDVLERQGQSEGEDGEVNQQSPSSPADVASVVSTDASRKTANAIDAEFKTAAELREEEAREAAGRRRREEDDAAFAASERQSDEADTIVADNAAEALEHEPGDFNEIPEDEIGAYSALEALDDPPEITEASGEQGDGREGNQADRQGSEPNPENVRLGFEELAGLSKKTSDTMMSSFEQVRDETAAFEDGELLNQNMAFLSKARGDAYNQLRAQSKALKEFAEKNAGLEEVREKAKELSSLLETAIDQLREQMSYKISGGVGRGIFAGTHTVNFSAEDLEDPEKREAFVDQLVSEKDDFQTLNIQMMAALLANQRGLEGRVNSLRNEIASADSSAA